MLSVIVPVRDWPTERVVSCVRSFAALPLAIVSEIVVVDFGSDTPIELQAAPVNCRVLRVEAARWSLAEATNAGVLAATSDIVAKTDADILVSRDSGDGLAEAVRTIANGDFGLLHAQVWDLAEQTLAADAAEMLEDGNTLQGRLRPRWGQGGLPIFSRKLWQSVGGYDSRFTGWGNEDNDFTDRVRRSGARIGWVGGDAIRLFHVWHPPSYHQTHVARERFANRRLAEADKSVFRALRFIHSEPSTLTSPQVIRTLAPLVTVAIATSARPGRDRMIVEAIGSYRGQIAGDYEVIVMDNGSDDASHETLRAKLKPLERFTTLRVERSNIVSIPKARNEISAIARGRYICVADDDDLALPNRLADHLRPFEKDGLSHGSYGGWIDFDEQSGLVEKNQGKARTVATMLKGTGKVLSHPSSFYRTDVMRAVPYDEALQLGSDWDLALRAAALGLRFEHTGSYVTLRRFHEANVTLTGSSNQVSTGLMARSRTWALYNPRQQKALIESAALDDDLLTCENDFSVAELLPLLPSYVGQWRLLLPFALLGPSSGLSNGSTALPALLEIVDGDLATAASGINVEVQFCSVVVRGSGRARRLARAITELVGQQPTIVSDRQFSLDRSQVFDWKRVIIPEGGGMVMSKRFSSVAEALEVVSSLPQNTLLRAAIQVISDFDSEGVAHYLAFHPTNVRSDAKQMITELGMLTTVPFRFARAPSSPNIPVDPTDRFH